jgi:hypothetical protein
LNLRGWWHVSNTACLPAVGYSRGERQQPGPPSRRGGARTFNLEKERGNWSRMFRWHDAWKLLPNRATARGEQVATSLWLPAIVGSYVILRTSISRNGAQPAGHRAESQARPVCPTPAPARPRRHIEGIVIRLARPLQIAARTGAPGRRSVDPSRRGLDYRLAASPSWRPIRASAVQLGASLRGKLLMPASTFQLEDPASDIGRRGAQWQVLARSRGRCGVRSRAERRQPACVRCTEIAIAAPRPSMRHRI